MDSHSFSTFTDQVAERLRQGIRSGHWRNVLPGRHRLAAELGCSHWTVEEAIQRLTKQGVLESQGPGNRRRIALTEGISRPRALRLMLLLYEEEDRDVGYLMRLIQQLRNAGHDANPAEKTMCDLGMDVARIARFVKESKADAWVVAAGSRNVLEWFAAQKIPAFALFGRLTKVPLASTSPKKADALLELVDRLVDLGHRRIVLLARAERRKPSPGFLEQLFLDRLEEHGIPIGGYNLPDWDDSCEGLHRILDSLFGHTPPSALIISQPMLYFATMQHLATLGISAPQHVSLACMDADPIFKWAIPKITHIAWDFKPIVSRVVKWADNISRGKEDRRKTSSKARLVPGDTIGPVPKGR